MYFPKKGFCGVFEVPLLKNAQKRPQKTQKQKKKGGTYLPSAYIRRFQKLVFFGAPWSTHK
jgi:hypothetical protein